MLERTRADIRAIRERDPACRSNWEAVLLYPGFHALLFHRLSHRLWTWKSRFFARALSRFAQAITGIDIHPGARIGKGVFIDHGVGVVIGETSEIEENVTLYQGVTLGGVSLKREKRHPTIRRNVVIGAGAKVLGPFEVGEGSRIGANSVVVKEVPPHSTVVGIPGRVVVREGKKVEEVDLEHQIMPDPVAQAFSCLMEHVNLLHRRLDSLSREEGEDHQRLEDLKSRLEGLVRPGHRKDGP